MLFDGSNETDVRNVTDGLSNTLAVVEVFNSDVPWFEPRDFDAANSAFVVSAKPNDIGSHHVGGANVSYCDGHVSFIADDIDSALIREAATIGGDRDVPID